MQFRMSSYDLWFVFIGIKNTNNNILFNFYLYFDDNFLRIELHWDKKRIYDYADSLDQW